MLESPPIVVPANVVPVGTIACPRNCRRGGFVPLPVPALAPTTAAATAASATAAAATNLRTPFMEPPSDGRGVAADPTPLGVAQAPRYARSHGACPRSDRLRPAERHPAPRVRGERRGGVVAPCGRQPRVPRGVAPVGGRRR